MSDHGFALSTLLFSLMYLSIIIVIPMFVIMKVLGWFTRSVGKTAKKTRNAFR